MVDLNVLLERAEHIKNTYATPYDFEVLEAVKRAIAAEDKLASCESRSVFVANISDEFISEFNATNKPGTLAILLEGIPPNSIVDEIINFGNSESTGPTERQVYKWFQESTIAHHIEEDGHHISKRAMFVAKKAWKCALQSAEKSKPDSWYDVDVIDALVRRLDVIINGEKGAARQAMLCDLVAQLEVEELPAVVRPDSAAPKQIEISDIVSIPCTHCGNKVNFAQPKPQRITEQDAREIAWDAVFSIGEKYGRDLHEAINRWWEWEGTGRTLLAKLNEHREPDTRSREIPVNDPIFYFVAQHYPMTAQHIERIYRECAHHYERREVNHVK